MSELLEEIGQKRTLSELGEYIKHVHELTGKDLGLKKSARLKKGKYKEFYEELYSLYLYSLSRYANEDSLFYIVVGNQNYDAVEENSEYKRKLEFTEYLDGKKINSSMKELNKRGRSSIDVGDVDLERKTFLEKFLDNAKSKSLKTYPNTTLIFLISYVELPFLFEDDIESFISELITELKKINFKADKVLIIFKKPGIEKIIDKYVYEVV